MSNEMSQTISPGFLTVLIDRRNGLNTNYFHEAANRDQIIQYFVERGLNDERYSLIRVFRSDKKNDKSNGKNYVDVLIDMRIPCEDGHRTPGVYYKKGNLYRFSANYIQRVFVYFLNSNKIVSSALSKLLNYPSVIEMQIDLKFTKKEVKKWFVDDKLIEADLAMRDLIFHLTHKLPFGGPGSVS